MFCNVVSSNFYLACYTLINTCTCVLRKRNRNYCESPWRAAYLRVVLIGYGELIIFPIELHSNSALFGG